MPIRICRNFYIKFPGGLRRLLITTAGDIGEYVLLSRRLDLGGVGGISTLWRYLHPIERVCGCNSHQTRWIPNFGFNAWCSSGRCISRAMHRVSLACHEKLCTLAVAFSTSTFAFRHFGATIPGLRGIPVAFAYSSGSHALRAPKGSRHSHHFDILVASHAIEG